MKIQETGGAQTLHNKKQKKRARKFKILLFWIKLILVLVLSTAAIGLIALSPIFNITGIEVLGGSHYPSDSITDLSGVVKGINGFKNIGGSPNHILELRYGQAEERILKNCPYIKNVRVKFVLPGKVAITLTERSPMGIVPYLGTSLLIDEEGYVLETVKNDEGNSLPLIKGLKFGNYELGQMLPTEEPENLEKAIALLKTVKASDAEGAFKLAAAVKWVDVGDLKKVCLFIDSRIVVNLGDLQDLDYRIRATKQILLKNIKKEEKGLLDFSMSENPVFIPEK